MKKAILVSLLLCASAFGAGQLDWLTSTTALTGSAPTLSTDGIRLDDAVGYRVLVSAGSGQTITGGALKCYFYDSILTRWMRCDTALDYTPATGARDSVSLVYPIPVSAGRIAYVPNAVTLSAGTTVSVTVEVFRQ